MRYAALIMAHKNTAQIKRLINSIVCDEIDVYVHLDKKWDISQSEISEIKSCRENTHILSKRFDGQLDTWSLIEIEMQLLLESSSYAASNGFTYGYYMLLSGQDYPVKSRKYILDFLEKSYPKPFIDIDEYESAAWLQTKFYEVRFLHKIEALHDRYHPGIRRKLLAAPVVVAEKITVALRGTPYTRLKKLGCKLYGGSAWWILPDKAVDYIINEWHNNRRLMKELSRVWTPEETFFQIMTMRSPVAGLVDIIDPKIKAQQNCLTYASFYAVGKGFCGHPWPILTEDLDNVMSGNHLFARKFDLSVQPDIFDRVDERINKLN